MPFGIQSQPPRSVRSQVLFIHNSSEYGGAEKHLIELLQSFSTAEIEASVLCLGSDFFAERFRRNHAPHVQIRCNRSVESFWDWFRVLRNPRPDAVVFVNAVLWTYPRYTPIVSWLAGIRRRFFIAHLPPPPLPSKVAGWSLPSVSCRLRRIRHLLGVRLSATFYTAIICVSNAIRDALVADYHFPQDKTVAIHNGVSLSKFDRGESGSGPVRIKLGIRPEEFLLVCVGRLSEQKAIDILLLAVARVLQDGVPCKCVIAGDGPLRKQLCEQALALNLSGHVFFEGFHEDVRPYLRAADAFILTSRREGLPLAVLEGMAFGLPCIVTNVGGNAEAITHMVEGIVVAPGSVHDVADAISYLVAHPQERLEMSRRARAKVREVFDINDKMAEIRRVILS